MFNICLTIMICSVLLGAVFYRRLSIPLRWILAATAFAVFTEIIGASFAKRYGQNTNVFLLSNPIEIALYVGFFFYIIPQKTIKWISILLTLYVLLASLVNVFFIRQTPVPVFYFIILKGVMITFLCLIFLYNLFALEFLGNKTDIAVLIIVTGLLFYYSFSAVLYSIWNYQMNRNEGLQVISQLRPFLFVVYSISNECTFYFC